MKTISIVINYQMLTSDVNAEELLKQEVQETITQLTASLRNQAGNVQSAVKFEDLA